MDELGLRESGGAGVGRAVVGAAAWAEQAELVERVAELVAERVVVELGLRPRARGELIDAREVARILGCQRSWVYEHQAELPVVRLGRGTRPRLRFDRAKVEAMAAAATAPPHQSARAPRTPRRRRRSSAPQLLEIKRRAP